MNFSENQVKSNLDNNSVKEMSPPEVDTLFNRLLECAKETPTLLCHESITPQVLAKVSTDTLRQYCHKLFFEAGKEKPTIAKEARNKLLSLTIGQSTLQRLEAGTIAMFAQHFPRDKDIQEAVRNRSRIDEGLASRQIALNTIAATSGAAAAAGAGLGVYVAAVGVAEAGGAVAAAGSAAGVGIAGTIVSAYAAGLVLMNLAVPAAAIGGVASATASTARAISNNFRPTQHISFKGRQYDLNSPSELRELCKQPNLHQCPEYPAIIDYAIRLSNEIYGIPRGRNSHSLAELCKNPSLSSMDVRNEDAVNQGNDLSGTYDGRWPIHSDISPLEALCENPNLFTLPDRDTIVSNVLNLASLNDQYKASKTFGYHLRPLKKLALHKHLAMAPSGLLEALKSFCDNKGMKDEKWAFARASQNSETFKNLGVKCQKLQEIVKKQGKVIEELLKKVEGFESDFITINQNLSEVKFNTIKNAKKIQGFIESGQYPSDTEIKELKDTVEKVSDACEKMQKKVNKVVENTNKMQSRISVLEEKVGKVENNLAKMATQQGYTTHKISKLNKFVKTIKDDMLDSVKSLSEKLEKLSEYGEVLQALSSPEAFEALSDVLEEHHTRKDGQRDMNALEKHLSEHPHLSSNPEAIKNIMDFAEGYKSSLMHLYKIAPTLTSGVVKSEAGRKSILKNLFSKGLKLIGSAMPTPAGQIGVALIETGLDDSSTEDSRKLMFDVQKLGMINDGYSAPEQRTDAQKTRVAADIISTHAIEMALYLASDPNKREDILRRKVKQYSSKVFDGFSDIRSNMDNINSGNGTSLLHQGEHKETIDPKSEAAAYMTKHALTPLINTSGRNVIPITAGLHSQMRYIKPKPYRVSQAVVYTANTTRNTAGAAMRAVNNMFRSQQSVLPK